MFVCICVRPFIDVHDSLVQTVFGVRGIDNIIVKNRPDFLDFEKTRNTLHTYTQKARDIETTFHGRCNDVKTR